MSHANVRQALRYYAEVGLRTEVDTATPHRTIQMLMEAAVSRLSAAAQHMDRGELASKGETIGTAITIIGGLQSSLDLERGSEIAANLNRLYDYMTRTLVIASAENDPAQVAHVRTLLSEVKSGWDCIAAEVAEEPGAN